MNPINTLLQKDTELLISARGLVGPEYAHMVQGCGEIIVIFGALLMVGLWIYGQYTKKEEYKYTALSLFFTIVFTFTIYAIINFGIPQWRAGPQEVVGGIAPLIPHPIDNSFPSGHALFTASLFVGIYHFYRHNLLLWLCIGCGIITVSARVIGGVHYPGDILGGLFFGYIMAMSIIPGVKKIVPLVAPILIRIASWIRL